MKKSQLFIDSGGSYLSKWIKIMKLITIFLLVAAIHISAGTNAQQSKLNLKLTKSSLKEALSIIEKQSDYTFLYNDASINMNKEVSVDAQNATIIKVMDELLDDSNVAYKIVNNQVVLMLKEGNQNSLLQEQKRTIKGKVTDVSGEPLPGVNVYAKSDPTKGVISGVDGSYEFLLSEGESEIVFSYIGFEEQVISVANRVEINVTLVEDVTGLDEVMIVGYGTQIKREVTGSIQQVDAEDLKNMPVNQVTQAMQGKVSGVQISQTTGTPGESLKIRVRGQSSVSAGSDPLYVVDGFPIPDGINNLNPNEIESITILKDASSTSLYGSRAANGVVLIQTKSANKDGLNVGISSYYGVQVVPDKGRPDVMNATEFAQFKKEYAIENNIEIDPLYQNPEVHGKGTDWYDVLLRKAQIQDHNLTIQQKNEHGAFSAVVGLLDQEGVMLNSEYKRYSGRLNSYWNLHEKVKLGFNLSGNYSESTNAKTDGSLWGGGILQSALLTTPIAPHKNPDGTIPETATGPGLFPNPNWYNVIKNADSKYEKVNLTTNLYLEFKPIKDLTIKSTINANLIDKDSDQFFNDQMGGLFAPPPRPMRAYSAREKQKTWVTEHTATYLKSLNNHNFNILLGFSAEERNYGRFDLNANDFADDLIKNFGAVPSEKQSIGEKWYESSLVSYFSRLNYNFNSKYFASFAVRRDGSSRFGSDNRYGTFPSGSLGWIVSEEGFFDNLDFINLLKIRASYGVTGNNQIGDYAHLGLVGISNAVFNNNLENGRAVSSIGNSELNWEETKQFDFGFDLGLWANRINFTYDYYQKNTTDLLFNVPIPRTSGFGSILTNLGEIKFWGYEFVLNTKVLTGPVKVDLDLNYSYQDNEILALDTPDGKLIGGRHINRVGERIGQWYGLIQDGVFRNQAEYDKYPHHQGAQVGTIRYRDVDNSGDIDRSDDRTVLGNSIPSSLFGFTLNANYKNWDLVVVGSGAAGYKVLSTVITNGANTDGVFNMNRDIKYRWRSPENPGKGLYGKTLAGTTAPEREWFSDRMIHDAKHLMIKNITLGYTVPLKSSLINELRVYSSVQQAFVFTDYPGGNPEAGASNNALEGGVDNVTYPVPRTWTFGINLNF
ncbi:MAG: TonB-dependent receptor [Carboxylicivirga sp.]|nr:TonB-dependent receptor [Carboxylicivirga sp.]